MTQAVKRAMCTNGHFKPIYAKGLCAACYRYEKRHGSKRPERLVIRL